MNILNRLKQWAFAQNEVDLSLSSALKNLVGSLRFNQISSREADFRQWPLSAAESLNISEVELLKRLAEQMNISVLLRPKIFDLSVLPAGITLNELRKEALLPVVLGSEITGIVCVDPQSLERLPGIYEGTNIFLSLCPAILACLDESAQQHELRSQRSEVEIKNSIEERVLSVFSVLAQKVIDKGSRSWDLLEEQGNYQYRYKDSSQQEWGGELDAGVAAECVNYLASKVVEDCSSLMLKLAGKSLSVLLTAKDGVYTLTFDSLESHNKVIPFPRVSQRENPLSSEEELTLKGSVLIVDDNKDFSAVLRKYLQKRGLTVMLLHDAEVAWEKISQGRVRAQLYICDVHMPGSGGRELLKKIKSNEGLKSTPVIVLSSDESSQTQVNLLEAGADAFVTKSQDPRILAMHIKRLLHERNAA